MTLYIGFLDLLWVLSSCQSCRALSSVHTQVQHFGGMKNGYNTHTRVQIDDKTNLNCFFNVPGQGCDAVSQRTCGIPRETSKPRLHPHTLPQSIPEHTPIVLYLRTVPKGHQVPASWQHGLRLSPNVDHHVAGSQSQIHVRLRDKSVQTVAALSSAYCRPSLLWCAPIPTDLPVFYYSDVPTSRGHVGAVTCTVHRHWLKYTWHIRTPAVAPASSTLALFVHAGTGCRTQSTTAASMHYTTHALFIYKTSHDV